LISRQQLLIADQRTALLESEEADISVRLIEALGGGFSAAGNLASNSNPDAGTCRCHVSDDQNVQISP
jgi:hypothetical protein